MMSKIQNNSNEANYNYKLLWIGAFFTIVPNLILLIIGVFYKEIYNDYWNSKTIYFISGSALIGFFWMFKLWYQNQKALKWQFDKTKFLKALVFVGVLYALSYAANRLTDQYYFKPKLDAIHKKYNEQMAAKQKAKETQNISKPK